MSSASDELPSALRSLVRSLRLGYRSGPLLIVVACVTTIAAAVPDALFALGFAQFAGAIIDGDGTRIVAVAMALAGLAAASWLLGLVSDRANRRFADRAAVPIESHVARLQSTAVTLEHHERPDYLDRLSVLRDHAAALSTLYQQLFSIIGAAVRLVTTVVLLMSVHPALGLLPLAAIPGVVTSTWRAGIERAVEEAGGQYARLARHLFVTGTAPGPGKEIRVARAAQRVRSEWYLAWRRRYRPLARTRWVSAGWQSAGYAGFGAGFVLCVWFVAWRGGSPEAVLLVLTAGSRLSQYVGQTVSQMHFFRVIWLDVSRRVAWLEDFVARGIGQADQPPPERLHDGIRLERVSFRYPGTRRVVLSDITLHLPAGTVIALVGENGAGKSSLVKLLCGFYQPTSGRIRVDGTDLTRISPSAWRTRLTGAFQDFFQFEFLARTSVGLGDLERAEDRSAVAAAVRRAGAEDLVATLPKGLETQLGVTWDGGVELSHGQWQKIALARGCMRADPLLLVLDEPTSALDAEAEHALFERFARISRSNGGGPDSGRITILVSHRFSTVQMADLIVVLDGSRVTEVGSHERLLARDGLYAELYRIQAAAYHTDR